MVDNEFIQRSQDLLKSKVEEADEYRSANCWAKKNPEGFTKCRKKYEATSHGKGTISLAHFRYRAKKEANLPMTEKEKIGQFYLDCPPGYEVDHIIPISKGGTHTLDNLQYLTASQNRQKSAKTLNEQCEAISSKQMLDLNMEELRIFLTWLTKKISGQLLDLPLIQRAVAPLPISCASVKSAIKKLKNT